MTLQLPDRNVEPGPGELGSLDALARVWRGVQQNFVKLADLFPLHASADTFAQVPQCRAYHNADQAISNSTFTYPALNSERWDTDSIHDTTTNNSRLTCRTPGLYVIAASVNWEATAGAGQRHLELKVNRATSIAAQTNHPGVGNQWQSVVSQYRMETGDYVEMIVYFDGGAGSLLLIARGNFSPELSMCWVSP